MRHSIAPGQLVGALELCKRLIVVTEVIEVFPHREAQRHFAPRRQTPGQCILRLRQPVGIAPLHAAQPWNSGQRLGMQAIVRQRLAQQLLGLGEPAVIGADVSQHDQRGCARIKRQRSPRAGFGSLTAALQAQRHGKVAMQRCILRRQHRCLTIAGNRFIEAIEIAQHQAETVVGIGQLRLQCQRMAVVRHSLLQPAAGALRVAQLGPGQRVVGPEPHGGTVTDGRLMGPAAVEQHVTEVVQCLGKLRLQFECLPIACLRLRGPTRIRVTVAEIVVRRGIERHQLRCPCQRFQCILTLLTQGRGQQLPERAVARPPRQQRMQRRLEFRRATLLEQRGQRAQVSAVSAGHSPGRQPATAGFEAAAAAAGTRIVAAGRRHRPGSGLAAAAAELVGGVALGVAGHLVRGSRQQIDPEPVGKTHEINEHVGHLGAHLGQCGFWQCLRLLLADPLEMLQQLARLYDQGHAQILG